MKGKMNGWREKTKKKKNREESSSSHAFEKIFQKLFSTLDKPNKGRSESYFVQNMFSANKTH